MSILIKGLNMPKDGNEVFIIIKPNGEVRDYHNILLTNAQAIQIPAPHGRLIDADALFQDLMEHNIPFNNDINSAINVAPTILEYEEL